eukprot:gene16975-20200_t
MPEAMKGPLSFQNEMIGEKKEYMHLKESSSSASTSSSTTASSSSNGSYYGSKSFPYEIVRMVGQGTFGKVYEAKNIENKRVAIKKVEKSSHFISREYDILKIINHPNCLRVLDMFITNEENKKMQNLAIKHIHTKNICHRDITPNNILLNLKGEMVLADFGSAKILDLNHTSMSYICSRYYRAPELLVGCQNYTTKIDIWSIGCILAEMLIGKPLFPGTNSADQLARIIDVLGSPTSEDMEAMKPSKSHSLQLPNVQAKLYETFHNVDDKDVVDLLSKIFIFDPSKRATIDEILAHPFLKGVTVNNLGLEQFDEMKCFSKTLTSSSASSTNLLSNNVNSALSATAASSSSSTSTKNHTEKSNGNEHPSSISRMTSSVATSSTNLNLSGKKPSSGSVTITMSDFQTYEMQSRQLECKKWIESVIGEELADADLHLALKDGVILCKLANTMFPNIIPRYNKSGSVTFKLIENINSKLGINENQIFIATDLCENKNIQKVIGTLKTMAGVICQRGFPIKWPTGEDMDNGASMASTTTTPQAQLPTINWDSSFINGGSGATTPTKQPSVGSNGRSSVSSPKVTTTSTTTTTTTGGSGSTSSSPFRSGSNGAATNPPKASILPGQSTIYTAPPATVATEKPSSLSKATAAKSPAASQAATTAAAAVPIIDQKIAKYEKYSAESKENMTPLHCAVREGDAEAAEKLLAKRPGDIDVATIYGRTALHVAVLAGHLECAKLLATNSLNAPDKDGNTALHLALLQGDYPIIELLVSRGCDVNAINKDESTPIMMVSLAGDEKIVDLLLANGADVRSSNKKGNTALHYATLRGHRKVVDRLLEAGSDVNAVNADGATSLHVAAEENYPGIIESLANNGATVDSQRFDGWTPLYTASYKGNMETALSLLSKGASVDVHNLDGWTPLHAACAEGHYALAELLVTKYGANVNLQDAQGTTPLYHCCSAGQLELVKLLLGRGANPELSKPGGWKPIHIACYNENDPVTRYLVDHGVNLNCGNDEIKGYAPIHILISTEEPRLEIIELLLKKRIDINKKNVNGSTPMHLAVFWNHFKVLELLLKYNAALDEKNNKGRTPLSLACHYGNEEVARHLAERMNIDPRKLKIKNNKQKILDMETPSAPPAPETN